MKPPLASPVHFLEVAPGTPAHLLLLPLLLSLAPLAAQTRSAGIPVRAGGAEFVLSRSRDLATQDRAFTTGDVLYMWVAGPGIRTLTPGHASSEPAGWWLLASATQLLQGSLTPADGGFRAELPLVELATYEGDFTWSASIERDGAALTFVSAAVTIAPSTLRADFALLDQAGEAPLRVRFEDRSQGPVTSWSWVFGDGATSNEREPTHVYSAPGSFRPSLTVTGPV